MTRDSGARNGATHGVKTRNRSRSVEHKLHVVCLAAGGGPAEDNVTGFLVRSMSTQWAKNSVLAVDAGSHLASISRILESDFPPVSRPPKVHRHSRLLSPKTTDDPGPLLTPGVASSEAGYESSSSSACSSLEEDTRVLETGPFAGLSFPFESSRANALHIVRECVSTYLITHPHLDHLSAFAINTAAFHNTSRPKRLAALPSTVNAIKTHIFNDVIWPNLTDEDGGVGFVTFQRLAEGGNVAVGDGRGRGYIEVCDGLCVKGLKISHGQCVKPHTAPMSRRGSDVGLSHATIANNPAVDGPSISPDRLKRPSFSLASSVAAAASGTLGQADPSARPSTSAGKVVVDSTAYFIQDDASGREVLVFGDVEPDALSLSPRTSAVWAEAAPKVASGYLKGIVIECSYEDSQGDTVLFGHLAPRWLISELSTLADMVRLSKAERRASRKRKRSHRNSNGHATAAEESDARSSLRANAPVENHDEYDDDGTSHFPAKRGRQFSTAGLSDSADLAAKEAQQVSPLSKAADDPAASLPQHQNGAAAMPARNSVSLGVPLDPDPPLAGITVLVMHIKDTFKDGPLVGDTILRQLQEHEARMVEANGVGLGCEFVISQSGGSYYF